MGETRREFTLTAVGFAVFLLVSCKLGPEFVRPAAPVNQNWLEIGDERISNQPGDYRRWWRSFGEPTLNAIVETVCRQNLSLQVVGARVLAARVQLGIAVGQLFPQSQYLFGNLQYNRMSGASPQAEFSNTFLYTQSEIGLSAAWELDFWGKYRRSIESAGAIWHATLADYDNALVSLIADAASFYIQTRTLEKRIQIATQNVKTQAENLRITEDRWKAGTTSQRDVEQARASLTNTQAAIPALQAQLQQARNGLSILMGQPPGNLEDFLGSDSGAIPVPPRQIAVGIPADLLRRRPDVRSAEYQAMAQSAQIGIAKADMLPAFSLDGTFGLLSSDVGASKLNDMFKWGSRTYVAGPRILWNVLNYGRLINNVRFQDAQFQQLIMAYRNAVLTAQQEVEDALAAFLKSQERAGFLGESTGAAKRSLDLAVMQYREGTVDFTTVLTAQQALLSGQDSLALTLGNVSGNMVSVYRALGGGWQTREGVDLLPQDVKEAMAKRIYWSDLLKPAEYIPK